MPVADSLSWCTPRESDPGLKFVANDAGLRVSVLRNG
jgi:hypothetical protein